MTDETPAPARPAQPAGSPPVVPMAQKPAPARVYVPGHRAVPGAQAIKDPAP